MWWSLAALAGITIDTQSWPDDVSLPTPLECDLPLPATGFQPLQWEITGILTTSGRFIPDPGSENPLTQCRFGPALFNNTPTEVPVLIHVTGPTPPITLQVLVRRKGGGVVPDLPIAIGEQSVRTDSNGRASFRNLSGDYALHIGDPRYRTHTHTVSVTPPLTEAVIWVTPEEGWELVARYSKEADRAGVYTIPKEEIELTPGTLGDPLRGVSNRPGLVRTPFESGWLLVRGGSPGDTGTYFDQVRIPLLYHLGGFASIIHPELVEQVTFWPGATPARLGRHTAGAVNVVPKKLGKSKQIRVGANLAFAHAFIEVPTKHGGFAIGFRRSYLDGVLAAAVGPVRSRIAPRFTDLQARLTGKHYSFSLLGLTDSIDAPTGRDGQIIRVSQRAVQLQARFKVPLQQLELQISPWIALWERGVDGRAEPQRSMEFFPGLRVELTPAQAEFLDWDLGIEGEYRTYRIRQGTVARQHPAQLIDPYVDIRIGRTLQLDTGIRLETLFVDGQLPRLELSPRATLRWKAKPGISLHIEASRTHQPPNPNLLIGLPDGAYLELQRADAISAGGTLQLGPILLTSQVWTRWIQRIPGFEQDGSLGSLHGRATGVENELVVDWAPLQLRGIYQYTANSRWEDPGSSLRDSPIPWSQPHRVQLISVAQLPKNWAISGRFRFNSGFPSPSVRTPTYDILTGRSGTLMPGDRLAPFMSVDLKINHRFFFRTWRLDAFLDLQNLTNNRIVEPILTGFDDTHPIYSKGLPFLPIFGFEGVFWPPPTQKAPKD